MKLPKSLELLGQRITVEHDPKLFFKDGVHGWCVFRENKIILQPDTEGCPVTKDQLEAAFFHELLHFIFYLAGEESFDPPLHEREFLVERISGLIHQAIKSADNDG